MEKVERLEINDHVYPNVIVSFEVWDKAVTSDVSSPAYWELVRYTRDDTGSSHQIAQMKTGKALSSHQLRQVYDT